MKKNSSSWLLTKKILKVMKKAADSIDAKFLIGVILPQDDVLNYKNKMLTYQLRFKELEEKGYEVLDLTPYLVEFYSKEKVNTYYKIDSHWNENGHKVSGEVIHEELIKSEFVNI